MMAFQRCVKLSGSKSFFHWGTLRAAIAWILNIPLKAHVLNAWSPGWGAWEVVEALRDGANREIFRSLGVCP
jgi:hypothetical protein